MNAVPAAAPVAPREFVMSAVRQRGYAVLPAEGLSALGVVVAGFESLRPDWEDLPPDDYLKDGGRYRRRRHSCFVVDGETLVQTPHRAHWQSLDYNALHGGMRRMFAPIRAETAVAPVWRNLLSSLGALCSELAGAQPWYVEAHQFRIDTGDGIGRPTPEGAHRDGVDFVAVILVGREGIKGGETRVFEADGPNGQRFTLTEPWSLLFLDDHRVIHESTPIQPLDPAVGGHRDTLVLTFRARAFQGED
ncbi:MAG: 2OG-Fe dioxygenase family protein [Pseudoxanthomonas sp.]